MNAHLTIYKYNGLGRVSGGILGMGFGVLVFELECERGGRSSFY